MTRPEPQPGEIVGAYRLEKELGRGGTSTVWQALHIQDGIAIALKWSRFDEGEPAARFVQEGELLARLHHPGIVRVFTVPDLPPRWRAMELLRGRTLAEHLQGGPVACDDALRWVLQAARALDHAHSQKIIHRDLNAANVFLCDDRAIKLIDFGSARDENRAAPEQRLTQFAPAPVEQLSSAPEDPEDMDARADIYALGALLAQLVLEELPWRQAVVRAGAKHQQLEELVRQKRNPKLWIDQLRPFGPALTGLIAACTAHDPNDRPQRVSAFIERATAVLAELNSPDRVATVVMPKRAPPPSPAGEPAAKSAFPDPFSRAPVQHSPAGSPFGAPIEPRQAATPDGRARADGQLTAPPDAETVPIPRANTQALAPPPPARPDAPMPPPSASAMPWGLLASAVVLGALVVIGARSCGESPPQATAPLAEAPPPHPAPVAAAAAPTPGPAPNVWVRVVVPNPPIPLGEPQPAPASNAFSTGAGVLTPDTDFCLQQREVAWSDWTAWPGHTDDVAPPKGVDLRLPATGMRQASAAAWCAAHGGALPTEEQWEAAARLPDLKPHPWGAGAPTGPVNAAPFSAAAALLPADDPTADQTPYTTPIFNLAGNAREWTASDWRTPDGLAPRPQPGMPFTKVVRGLPLLSADELAPPSGAIPSATWRSFRCSGFNCTGGRWFERRDDVGFRCAKPPPCTP